MLFIYHRTKHETYIHVKHRDDKIEDHHHPHLLNHGVYPNLNFKKRINKYFALFKKRHTSLSSSIKSLMK